MDDKIFISFVIPVYNNYRLLIRCIDSIVRQEDKSGIEIVIIDDTPLNKQMCINGFVSEYNFVKCYKNSRNMGVTYSRNKGWFSANGEYVVFLDSDDILIPGALEALKSELFSSQASLYFFRTIDLSDRLIGRVMPRRRYLFAQGLIDTYNKGERLVCMKKTNSKPFVGCFRGHEFAGLLKYLSKINDNSIVTIDAGFPLRVYCDDNEHSISNGTELKKRKNNILSGHLFVMKWMFKNGRYSDSFFWFLRYIKVVLK
ncbi:glycosyltransferase family 2 protein [Vibrio cholerae]|uniref:glycosyltransferase family 2 protein n=1 Tax=Vibrio cholerae TaxID=666 RepID=UPI001157977B|nr:glycosyltransferase family 2 protein [Vibrio cholerae]EGR1448218.1 glycosyltransferase family 2 protein [Vibrio cholerae]EGR2397690.1 glycosyltransferase family 2 protein [Vibrio cholerae]EGR2401376.1 glycosyltransferase family 2 protein [Vibrio cholerae]EGR2529562.1 glycosyltransferase family 2 protein [Vibrio cholerae]EKF9774803.1 glycosyltransferase family 2 protein [Vibrio cholerae]